MPLLLSLPSPLPTRTQVVQVHGEVPNCRLRVEVLQESSGDGHKVRVLSIMMGEGNNVDELLFFSMNPAVGGGMATATSALAFKPEDNDPV